MNAEAAFIGLESRLTSDSGKMLHYNAYNTVTDWLFKPLNCLYKMEN